MNLRKLVAYENFSFYNTSLGSSCCQNHSEEKRHLTDWLSKDGLLSTGLSQLLKCFSQTDANFTFGAAAWSPLEKNFNPLWGHCQEYKIEKKSNPTRASFIRKKKRFCLLQPYLVWKFLSHWSRKTSPKVRGTLKNMPKVVSKRSHQEECVQSAKTAKSVASCVASQVLQVADKLPSFPRKAEFSQIER